MSFEQVNDTYGHKAGNRVLQTFGEIVRLNVRAGAMPCRYGGEEFDVVRPETAIQIPCQRAEQIRTRFHAVRFFKGGNPVVPILSIRVAAFPEHGRIPGAVPHAAARELINGIDAPWIRKPS